MNDLQYVTKVRFGSVRMAEPTGRWVQDPDGWWREIYTDAIWFDRFGFEERREPFEALIRMNMPPWAPDYQITPARGIRALLARNPGTIVLLGGLGGWLAFCGLIVAARFYG